MLSIPYIASNQPNERSRFGNSWETINYTIQGVLVDGFNEELLMSLIQHWQEIAESEFAEKPDAYTTRSDTPMAKHVEQCLVSLKLGFADISSIEYSKKDSKALQELLKHVKYRKDLLYELLQNKILPQLSFEPSILHSDACNHIDLYHTAQGLTGTPWNSTTFHDKMQFDLKHSLGTDGYTKSVLLDKNLPIQRYPNQSNADELIGYLVSQPGKNRVLIDVCAQFAGYSNLEIAKLIAKHLAQTNEDILWVQYFNSDNVLCALNSTSGEIIELRTSNPKEINQVLGCQPDKRWTYCDQSHAESFDSKQMQDGNAQLIMDRRTSIKSYLQAAMRMRDLDKDQTISIFVPPDTPDNYTDLLNLMEQNQALKLQEDNFYAAIDKMNNQIREDFLARIALIPKNHALEKHRLYQKMKDYFVDTKPKSLFEQFGEIYYEQATLDLLNNYQKQVIADWERILSDAEIEWEAQEKTKLESALTKIVDKALPLCSPTMISYAQRHQELGIEVEKELLKEIETEQEKEQEMYDPKLVGQQPHRWASETEPSPWLEFIEKGVNTWIHPLSQPRQIL